MGIKKEILLLLEKNRDRNLSGQEMAQKFGVTRAAIWKAVGALREEGYHIEAVNNRGYRLAEDNDILSAEGIRVNLPEKYRKREICVLKNVDSTSQEVKRRALTGVSNGFTVLSEEQSAGKGRMGRKFYSPRGTGIYMSVLFYPEEKQPEDVVLITTAAAVAVCRAIRKVLGEQPEIKWVNDVYYRGKKVCGILTEASSNFENGRIDTVIVGIGINYRVPEGGYPDELREIAGAVCSGDKKVPRNELAAAVLAELYEMYEGLAERTFLGDYRQFSNVIGERVRFSSGADWEEAVALDIDEDGGLVVEKDSGERLTLRTGEITLRRC